MLRVFKLVSPMSVGTWSLTLFSLPLTVVAALSLLSAIGINFELGRKVMVVVGLVPGFCSAAYKGVLLSTNAQPGWKDARWMGGYLTNSAFLLGCAQLLVLSDLMGQAQAAATLHTAFIVLLVLNVIPLGLLVANLRPTFAQLFTRDQQWRVGSLALVFGTLVPVVLMLLGDGLLLASGAVISLLLGSWLIRFVYIKIPHTSPLDSRTVPGQ
jgi:hypothetical protein